MGEEKRRARRREVAEELQRVASLLAAEEAEALRVTGLSPVQLRALRILAQAAPAGVSCSTIKDGLLSQDPDVTRLLDRLAKDGLVRREKSAQDLRFILNYLTPAGEARLAAAEPALVAHREQRFEGFKNKHLKRFEKLLGKLTDGDCS